MPPTHKIVYINGTLRFIAQCDLYVNEYVI